VGTGDFNADGKTDLRWRDTGGNTAIWFMNGTQVASTGGSATYAAASESGENLRRVPYQEHRHLV
jgi:hypothetical protein